MPNGRCRMHGGKSTGRPIKHGYYTQEAIIQRQQLNELIGEINRLSEELGEGQGGC